MRKQTFTFGQITWTTGDEWNPRVYRALRLIDAEAAKTYFFTTVKGVSHVTLPSPSRTAE